MNFFNSYTSRFVFERIQITVKIKQLILKKKLPGVTGIEYISFIHK